MDPYYQQPMQPVAQRNDPQYIAYLEQRLLALEARLPRTNLLSPRFMTRAWAVFGHHFVAQLILMLIVWAVSLVIGIIMSLVFGASMAALFQNMGTYQ